MAKRKVENSATSNIRIFINCPFDDEYLVLLRPLLFTIIYLGFEPLIASHRNDSGDLRMRKVIDLIQKSDMSIHDLSRAVSGEKGEHFRLNMPFEFGIDWGHRNFVKTDKKMLVLEDKPYNATRSISDLAGCDLQHHNNLPEELVYVVRSWLHTSYKLGDCPLGSTIWYAYNEFYSDLFKKENWSNKDVEKMPTSELISKVSLWVQKSST